MTSHRINLCWGCLVTVYGLIHIFLLPHAWGNQSISDTGIFSYLTLTLLILSLFLVLKSTRIPLEFKYKFYLFSLAYVLLIYVLREADFHRLFTDEHVTKGKFYTNQDISLQQKILGGIPMALFFISVFYLLATQAKLVWSHFFARSPWAIALFLWGLTFIASQLTDKSDLNDVYFGRVIEEMLEFCASGYVLLAVTQSISSIRNLSISKN